jgi:cathepsin L
MKGPRFVIGVLLLSLVLGLICSSSPLLAQNRPQAMRIDYAARELQAPPAIKQQLQALRAEIQTKRLTYQVGYTKAMDYRLGNLAGGRPPGDLANRLIRLKPISEVLLKNEREAMYAFMKEKNIRLPELQLACAATASAWEWRRAGKVTPVRDQRGCGSCWAFAAIGAYESSYFIRNNREADASEQCILNCSGAGTCGGGWYDGVFNYLINTGAATEAAYPYTANDLACQTGTTGAYRAVVWGGVHPEVPIPTVAEIKQALCEYGPLAIGVLVTPAFQAYVSGVFNQPASALIVTGSDGKRYWNVNHCVTLIGWDDSKGAWLIKNSWGTDWGETCGYGGERGYMWIAHGSSNVALFPNWVRARSNFYMVDFKKYQLYYPQIRVFPEPQKLDIRR